MFIKKYLKANNANTGTTTTHTHTPMVLQNPLTILSNLILSLKKIYLIVFLVNLTTAAINLELKF